MARWQVTRPACPGCGKGDEVTVYEYRGKDPVTYVCWSCGSKWRVINARSRYIAWLPSIVGDSNPVMTLN